MDVNGLRWLQLQKQYPKKSYHQLLRLYIQEGAGIGKEPLKEFKIEHQRIKKYLGETFSFCLNRLLLGYFRYGKNTNTSHFNTIPAVKNKINRYIQTGNIECLIDAINYIHLEIQHGTNPLKHFKATDDEDHASMKHKY